ncbi:hypothetical protein [Chitinophaga sp. YIM B06452]|uniref:hypothetical protein n=1 Tax=Chitinophaga sp. YIM B06452 TaxID=3082158 RepID=UPI0031FEB6CB
MRRIWYFNGKPRTACRISVPDLSGRLLKTSPGVRGNTHVPDISPGKGLYLITIEGGDEIRASTDTGITARIPLSPGKELL